MSIGLKRGTVSISEYDEHWEKEYELEKVNILRALEPFVRGIEHVGSTSVPGLDAKPIIDILLGIDSLRSVDCMIPILESIGYEYIPERISDERAFFPKGSDDNRTHYLSIVEFGGKQWVSTIAFRDRLRESEDLCKEYCLLKSELAERYSQDRYTYSDLKKEFMNKVIA